MRMEFDPQQLPDGVEHRLWRRNSLP
jgi:hypothetical protein